MQISTSTADIREKQVVFLYPQKFCRRWINHHAGGCMEQPNRHCRPNDGSNGNSVFILQKVSQTNTETNKVLYKISLLRKVLLTLQQKIKLQLLET